MILVNVPLFILIIYQNITKNQKSNKLKIKKYMKKKIRNKK